MKSKLFNITKIGFIASFILLLVYSCSTEKNTLVNRTYHGLTAHYNGYFNANELIRESMDTYISSYEDNFYQLLVIDPIPNEEEVVGMYPAIDTAITKCKKVIRNHSMPNNDRPARKKDEHNAWIDENWTTIGIASFYRRDYEGAMKSFKYVRKFYSNDPSLYVGELWMAKTHLAQGEFTKAKFNLDNLDKAIAGEESRKDSKKKSKKSKDDEIAKFPKKIRFELEKTKAHLALLNENNKEAIKYLEESLLHARMNDDKSRVHFILGQLYHEEGNIVKAEQHFTKVVKGKAEYNIRFNARLKRTFLGGGDKVRKELNKMLRDAKNAEYKDQIYYALADIEFKEKNEEKGVEYLTLSAFYSTKNTRQKGMAYERLADLSFSKRNYVSAQKYYDSCGNVINDKYPNAEGIRNKASNLFNLVVAVETAEYEDSVQQIALLSENERDKFLKDLIKQIKKEEADRKKREAARLRELQDNENLFVQVGNGSKWYWNNAKTRAEGFNDFKQLWGVRENEDDWRRSEKTVVATFEDIEVEVGEDSLFVRDEDTLTVENLLRWIPLTDSALSASNTRLIASRYDAGVIYKEQLLEKELAITEFELVLSKKIENEHNLLASYQLYKIYIQGDPTNASKQKNFILEKYPDSDYAKYLLDPDYFIKKKERDALAEQAYVRILDRYSRGLHYPVLTKATTIIDEEKENVYRSKYMLLKALCIGELNENKNEMLPTLNALILEYPETGEAVRAQELIDIIKNGYSENVEIDFESKYPFDYNDNEKYRVIIFLDGKSSSSIAKTKITDFHREYFSRDKLKVTSKVYTEKQSIVLVDDFIDDVAASNYIRIYKRTRKYLLDLQHAEIFMISNENLKILMQKHNLSEYQEFYDEYF